jgi:hypothetical protein
MNYTEELRRLNNFSGYPIGLVPDRYLIGGIDTPVWTIVLAAGKDYGKVVIAMDRTIKDALAKARVRIEMGNRKTIS